MAEELKDSGMEKLTSEQERKFLEWVGYSWVVDIHDNYWSETQDYSCWHTPSGADTKKPDIYDLNWLFREVTPKLMGDGWCPDIEFHLDGRGYWCKIELSRATKIGVETMCRVSGHFADPAITLIKAIWEVIK